MTEPVLRMSGVGHQRRPDGSLVVRDLDLTGHGGQVVVLQGRSGSGKSTVCQLAAGLERPLEGEVRVGSTPAHEVDDWARVALLPQRLGLAEDLTVAENVFLPAWVRRLPTRPELLEALDLTRLADRRAGEVSRGEQQRTALARAAVLGPAVLVLDEPTSHQDEGHADLVLEVIASLAGDGGVVVVASHDPRVAGLGDVVVDLSSPPATLPARSSGAE
jgi:ABC-type lipoprotein export system ATPase subunit